MRILLVGAGRMGARHLRGLAGQAEEIHVVDPRPEALEAAAAVAAEAGFGREIVGHASLADALAVGGFTAAVLAETAAGRAQRVQQVLAAGIRSLLVEKPLEQSRAGVHAIVQAAAEAEADVRCNLLLRGLPAVPDLRAAGGPYSVAMTGGAYGLACNGIQWIDLALYLDGGGGGGRLAHGVLDREPIGSGRGPQFGDLGGFALYELAGGSRLYIDCMAASSAPQGAIVVSPTRHLLFELAGEGAVAFVRDPASTKPPYLYGHDYARTEVEGVTGRLLVESTTRWLEHVVDPSRPCFLPEVSEAAVAHDLLFDVLETSGETLFPIT